jgi:O-antigen ligase
MRRLFYLMLLIIPAGRLISTSLFESASASKVASLTPDQIILLILIIVYLCTRFQGWRVSVAKIRGSKPILFFASWALISLLLGKLRYGLTVEQTAFSALYLARWAAYCALFYIAYDLASSGEEVKKTVKWLVTGCGFFAVFGLIQAAFLPDFAFVLHPDAIPSVDFDLQGHRLVSTFLDPNIAAGYILIFALVALSFWIQGYSRWLGIFLLLGGALFATLSRGGILGFAVGVAILFTGKKFPWKRAVIGMLALVLLAYVMYPTLKGQIQDAQRIAITDPSALSRVQDWASALDIIFNNPVVGIGFDTLGFVGPRFGVIRESATAFGLSGDLITICVLTGLMGLTLYLWIYLDIIKGLSRLRERTQSTWVRAYARGVQAATIAVLISSSFTTLVLYPQIMAVLWILWALGKRLECGLPAPVPKPASKLAYAPS